jgi:hypothetical protein
MWQRPSIINGGAENNGGVKQRKRKYNGINISVMKSAMAKKKKKKKKQRHENGSAADGQYEK